MSDGERQYVTVEEAPEWVRQATTVRATADVGQTPAQAYERKYGCRMSNETVACHTVKHGRIPARYPHLGGEDDFRFFQRWSLDSNGHIFYADYNTAALLETSVSIDDTPESQRFTTQEFP